VLTTAPSYSWVVLPISLLYRRPLPYPRPLVSVLLGHACSFDV